MFFFLAGGVWSVVRDPDFSTRRVFFCPRFVLSRNVSFNLLYPYHFTSVHSRKLVLPCPRERERERGRERERERKRD